MPDMYDTSTLVQVVPNLKVAQTFLLDTFFPNVIEYDTEYVAVDVEIGKRRLAPFCSPLVQGKVVDAQRIQTNTFRPPYIKDKRAPDLRRPVRRAMGEQIGGSASAGAREEANIVYEMTDQIQMINRRLEWMAASALRTGSITVTGEGYPTTVINFQRDAALTVTLTSTARWGQSAGLPADGVPSTNVEAWSALVLQKSGAPVTDIIFTNDAWNLFKQDKFVVGAIDTLRGGPSSVDLGGGQMVGALFKGRWGSYRLWVYNDWYVDPADDTEKPMLPAGTVLLGTQQLMGTRAFGMIMDPAFNYGAMAYAPKTWVTEDPAQRFLMMQSAPLVIPSRVNASFGATVL